MTNAATTTVLPSAEEVRDKGDATAEQRAELKKLLEERRYPIGWRRSLFKDVRRDGGLTELRARSTLNWLRQQPYLDGRPAYASDEQVREITDLLRVRLCPGPIARRLRTQITEKTLSWDQADLALVDLRRLPAREYPALPAGQRVHPNAVPDGYYAIVGTDARTHHYHVTTAVLGARKVKRLNGPRKGRNVIRAQVPIVLEQIGVDPAAAAKLYAEEVKQCAACNKPLRKKDQPGYAHGFGEKCWADRESARKVAEHKATIPDD